ncbi:hypothetical protein [Pendulispora albinea]|uniref:Tetratricopeptide repeat protein n=1 Tax=Pendulispora albinea TaxID=2741071 RepID=A0ABZ2M1C3_9BACT
MDSYVLLAATLVFAVYLVFRFRPSVFSRSRRASRGAARTALRDAKARLHLATTDEARAACLGDAAEASANAGLANGAVGYYIRAMRLEPHSAALVDRAASSLAEHPRALETLLWRRLGAQAWTGPAAAATHAAIRHLAILYTRPPLRHTVRARTFAHALAALAPDLPPIDMGDARAPSPSGPSTPTTPSSPEPRTASGARGDGSAPANP